MAAATANVLPSALGSPRIGTGRPDRDAAAPTPTGRIIDATVRCLARWGVAKTTLDDVARQAGCSRATIYRLFPGGKDGLLTAVVDQELATFFAGITAAVEGATGLEDVLVGGITEAARRLGGHPVLRFLAVNEPEALVPLVTFAHKDRILFAAAAWIEPWLAPWLGPNAARAGEWVARIVLSYVCCPTDGVDLADEASTRRLVTTFVLPGLERLAGEAARAGHADQAAHAGDAAPAGHAHQAAHAADLPTV